MPQNQQMRPPARLVLSQRQTRAIHRPARPLTKRHSTSRLPRPQLQNSLKEDVQFRLPGTLAGFTGVVIRDAVRQEFGGSGSERTRWTEPNPSAENA
jgi:hypothetical protein